MVAQRYPIRCLALILATALMLAATQLAAASPSPSTAAAIGCTQAELAAALAAGGSISFNCGPGPHSILFDTPLLVTTTASIDGGDQITASGQNTTTLFLVQPGAALTLTHLTVAKGFANGDGGAIRVASGGSLVIDSSTFSDNHTTDPFSGGAILSRGKLKISNSTFDHNSAGNGGALNPRDGTSSTDIRNTLFQNNYTTNATNGWGGAMLLWVGAVVTVQNSQFISNTASSGDFSSNTIDRGGAVHVTASSSLTVTGSQFAGNSAFFGGALYVAPGGSLTVTGGDLHGNSIGVFDGTQGGGAIYNAGTLLVDSSQLHDNFADGGGGAIENWGDALVRNAVFRRNQAGGGAAIANSGDATILTTTIANNSAIDYGGAIDAVNEGDVSKAMTITASTLSGNSAALEGGAILAEMRLALSNVTISGNSGATAVDVYVEAITLTNVTIAQNTAKGSLRNNFPTQLADG